MEFQEGTQAMEKPPNTHESPRDTEQHPHRPQFGTGAGVRKEDFLDAIRDPKEYNAKEASQDISEIGIGIHALQSNQISVDQ
jgi:hypothetical protein